MKKYVVIYLDLLGFESFSNKDSDAALRILEDFQEVLSMRRLTAHLNLAVSVQEPLIKLPSDHTSLDSFECFLPMSDSVFILSDEPEKVAAHLSTFLVDSFVLRGHTFRNADISDVHKQRVTIIGRANSGEVEKNAVDENWYPVLFRGGISYGDAEVFKTLAIDSGEEVWVRNVRGPGVIQAVRSQERKIEGEKLKGNRILCDRQFIVHLCSNSKRYLRIERDAWELLWPAFSYIDRNGESNQRDVLDELFWPAFRLWQCYSGKPKEEEHYRAFLELIVRSHIAYAGIASNPEPVCEYMHETLDKAGLRLSGTDLNAKLVFPKVNDNAQER